MISSDDNYLLAVSKQDGETKKRSLIYWPLEKNEDSFRINVSLDGIAHCFITPDNEYLLT